MKNILLAVLFMFCLNHLSAQINIEEKLKRKLEQRADQKLDEAIDKTLDKTEEGVKDAAKSDKKKKKENKSGNESENVNESNDSADEPSKENTAGKSNPSLKTYSTFDFVPGEKIIVQDDFSNVSIGDFPSDWNTNSGGEIVTVDGEQGKWLMINKEGVFMPDYIGSLPENFTMQFDVMANEDFNYYSGYLMFTFLSAEQRERLNDFGQFSSPNHGVRISLHPKNMGGGNSKVAFVNWNKSGEEILSNSVSTSQFVVPNNIKAHVSIWRQKQRLRVYLNEEKVLDIPRAFDATSLYNAFSICMSGKHQEQDRYLLANLNLAVGAPDTRSKLITEGKLVTRGILFDSGSDKIKPESYGTLKDIAGVLKENPTVNVMIIGHTDSDGDEKLNLELSKKRAQAVKETLTKEFAVDASRMQADGMGETQPSDKNDTALGKANNRRVEFVKL